MRALIVFAVAAAALASTSFSADAAGPPPGRPLGGVNLNYYCAYRPHAACTEMDLPGVP